jgi:hypothetical protein
VQIEYVVSVNAEFLNFNAQGLKLVQGLHGLQCGQSSFSNGAHVGLCIVAQLFTHSNLNRSCQVDPIAIEVFIAEHVVTPGMGITYQLRLPNGVDGGHQNDFTLDQALFVSLGQHRHQVVHGHGARHLIGVNGRLHVNLGAGACFAKAQHRNSAATAGGHAGQNDGVLFKGHMALLLKVEKMSLLRNCLKHNPNTQFLN